MMFRTATLTMLVATIGAADALPTCFDYSEVLASLDLGQSCGRKTISKAIKNAFKEVKKGNCKGGFNAEIRAMTNTTSNAEAAEVLNEMCSVALANAANEAPTEDWGSLGSINIEEYFDGLGPLNLETGNFQQEYKDFEKNGGEEKFVYIGLDTRLNDHYPTTEASYQAGVAVNEFYYGEAKSGFLTPPTENFQNGCEASKTAVCCWHRDRQYFDNNGNCGRSDCANQEPGDNTDLCWTESDGDVYPYPGDKTEGDLHCHGFAWGDDAGINTNAKWNNLFYVSMYDHMYQRGYVESLTGDKNLMGSQAMCGCVEDMAPVARADCTEAVGLTNYTISVDENGYLEVSSSGFELEFNACEGIKFVEGFTPEDYEIDPNDNELKDTSNDLAAFVFRQYLEGKMDEENVDVFEQTIIGYRKPEVQNNDNAREAACEEAFENAFPGKEYKEVEVEEA